MRSDLLFPVETRAFVHRPAPATGATGPAFRHAAGSPGRSRRPLAVLLAGTLLFLAGLAVGDVGPAAAQSDPSLQAIVAKLNRLEADLNSLQRNVYRGTIPDRAEGGSPAPSGDIGSQLYTYEESLRRLTSQVEELAHQQRQMDDRLTRLSEDVEFRLQEIEGKLGISALGGGGAGAAAGAAAATAATPAAEQPAGTSQLGTLSVDRQSGTPTAGGRSAPAGAATAALTAPTGDAFSGTPRERYNASLRLIRVGQLAEAEAALQSFLKEFPKDDLAGNAQYWLGETYYARNEYEQAAAAFLAGYRGHPDSAKAPDNLLKLGVSLVAMGEKDKACPVFNNLISEFPQAPRLILDRARSEKQRAGC